MCRYVYPVYVDMQKHNSFTRENAVFSCLELRLGPSGEQRRDEGEAGHRHRIRGDIRRVQKYLESRADTFKLSLMMCR